MNKKLSVFCLLVVFCLGGTLQAAWYWTNAAGTRKWVDGSNWDNGYPASPDASTALSWTLTTPDQYPPTEVGPGDAAFGQTCRIAANAGQYGYVHIYGGTCSVREIRLGEGGTAVVDCNGLGELIVNTNDIDLGYTATGDGTLNVRDSAKVTVQRYLEVGVLGKGTLNVSGNATVTTPVMITNQYLTIGTSAGAVGVVNLSDNGTINVDDFVHIGDVGTGTLNMTGGTLTVTNYEVNIADRGGTGTLNLSAGTISTGRHFNIGGANAAGTAVMNMTGGTVNCALTLNIPETAGCQGTLNLEGGTFNASALTMRAGGLLNVAGGTLRLNGNVVTNILNNSQIIGHYGYGTISAVYDGSAYTFVTAIAPSEPYMLSPVGSGVDPAANLSWRSAQGAVSATVYFGTDEALVAARDASVRYADVTSPFDVFAGDMPYGTTYYWVVDETDGVNTWSSPVVSFTTIDLNPYARNLTPVGTNVPRTANLDWTPGYFAAESHLYFGTDEAAVLARSTDPNVYRGIQTPPYDPVPGGDLPYMTTYYWVVDTVGDDGQGNTFWPGTVVSFTTQRPTPPTTATWDPNDNFDWEKLENWAPNRMGAGVTSNIGAEPNNPAIITNGYIANEARTVRIGVSRPGKVRVESGSVLQAGAGSAGTHKITVGYDADGYLEVDGGTAIGGQWFEVGYNAGVHGTVIATNGATIKTAVHDYNKNASGSSDTIISGGSSLIAARDLYIGSASATSGPHTLTINDDGSLVSGTVVFIGNAQGSRGIVTVNGGTLQDRGNSIRVGQEGDGELIVNGGVVNATSLRIPFSSTSSGTGRVQLNGGLIVANGFLMYDGGAMDITGGTLKIQGNAVNTVLNTYAGKVTAYGGWGSVNAVYDETANETTVTAIAPDGSVIDPFDAYADTAQLNAAWTVSAGDSLALETTTVYAGKKAMRFYYSGSESQARRALSLDISTIAAFEAKALTLYFAGQAGNTDLPLFVRLESTSGSATIPYDGSTSLADTGWVEWNLDLAGFEGVNLNAITGIAIVVGDGSTSGSGTLYLDHIRFYPSRCLPDLATGDVNGNCISDPWDFAVLAMDWLDSGYTVTPADPGTDGLVLRYRLDDSTVADETGNYPGAALGTGGGFSATGGYDGGGYLTLAGTNYIEVPPASLSTIASTGEITISVWVRGSTSMPVTQRQMLFSAKTAASEGHILTANIPSGTMPALITFEAGHDNNRQDDWASFFWGWDSTSWEAPESAYRGTNWNHFAFTKDIATGEQKIYHNGQIVALTKKATTPIDYVGMFTIGNFHPGGNLAYYGDVDDFRIYDHALTPDEVLFLAGGSAYYQPVISDADFDDSGDIGLGDLAILAAKWLEIQLWPAP